MDTAELTRAYLSSIERGDIEGTQRFFSPDVVQTEFPNRIVPNGAVRDLTALHEAALRGQRVILEQHYDIKNLLVSGSTVLVELLWRGKLAVAFGSLAVGDEMRAHSATVIEFRDGKIVAQRNYDCFEPF